MNILILDSNTFIGREIANKFLKLGHNVYVLNNGKRMPIDGIKYIVTDRNSMKQMSAKLQDAEFDIVVDISADFAEQTKIILNYLFGRVRHYVYVSSAAVYKKSSLYPITENSPRGYNSTWEDYSIHKYFCEEVLFKAYNDKNFPVTILRPFYIYGSGNDLYQENYIFQRLIQKMPIILPANGYPTVQFGHVCDLANAAIKIILNENTFGQAYNLSGREHISIAQWVDTCAEVVGEKANIYCVDADAFGYRTEDFFPLKDINFFGSIDKLSKLGIEPEFSLIQGLRQTYNATPKNILQCPPLQTKQEREILKWKTRGFI